MDESNISNKDRFVLSPDQQENVRIAELTSSCLSVLGSGSIIIAVIVKRKILNPEVYPLFHLSLADLLASITVIISLVLFGHKFDNNPYPLACAWISSLAWGLYLTTFLLTLIYAFEAYRRTKDQLAQLVSPYYTKEPTYSCTPWYLPVSYTIAWIIPLLGAVLYYATQERLTEVPHVCRTHNYECLIIFHQKKDPCLDSSGTGIGSRLAMKSFFLTSFFLCSVGIMAFYYLTHRAVTTSQHSSGVVSHKQYEAAKRIRNRGILYCVIFIVCWLPASIVGIISFTEVSKTGNLIALFILQGAIANLQGFLNCLIYGWIRGGFKSALNLYSVRDSKDPLSIGKVRKRKSKMNYQTFTVYSDDEYDTMSDADINKLQRISPAEEAMY